MTPDDTGTEALDEHQSLMTMADRELDYRIKALNSAARVLTAKNDSRGAFSPGGATPPSVAPLLIVADWLLDEREEGEDYDELVSAIAAPRAVDDE